MRRIPLETWARREHYETFSSFKQPHFAMCANMDITALYPHVKEHGHTFTVVVIYFIARAANAVPEFRQRISQDGVIEHEVVHPSSTVLTKGDLFTFCTIEYAEEFPAFGLSAAEKIAYVKEHPTLEEDKHQDDLLFMTPIPWLSFTSFMHPLPSWPPDSVPRFAWGKRFEEGDKLKMPLAAQAHHALMDGIHMCRFYELMQEYMDHPARVLGG